MMCENQKTVYAVIAPICFPEGFSVGHGGKSNSLEIERNGEGAPVLRGSSIAGILRATVAANARFSNNVENYFGKALENNTERQESALVFHDLELKNLSSITMHNLICRHTGSISENDKGLFSIERTAPGVSGELFFTLSPIPEMENPEEDEELLNYIISLLNGELLIGGNSNRGGGRCCLKDKFVYFRKFNLQNIADAADYLDLLYADKRTIVQKLMAKPICDDNIFSIELTLGIPNGQDFLSAEGSDTYPVMIRKADGKDYWKIPGSSLRGIFKGWFSRLAARDGKILVDSAKAYRTEGNQKTVEMQATEDDDFILSLFGSLNKRGRIHICDAYSAEPVNHQSAQFRSHVVIDRFTGGTNDGKLFSNSVLVGNVQFSTVITIKDANVDEINYLQKTLQALHIGILRVGSSKATGRLEILSYKINTNKKDINFTLNLKGVEHE